MYVFPKIPHFMAFLSSAINENLISPLNETIPENTQYTTLASVLGSFFNLAMGVGISIILINLAYGFIQYVTSKGEAKETKKAWQSVSWTTYALIIILASYALKNLVMKVLGANEPTNL